LRPFFEPSSAARRTASAPLSIHQKSIKKPRTAGGQSAWYFLVVFFKVLPDLPLPDLAMIHHACVYVDPALSFFDRLCKLPFGSLWNGSHSHDRFNNNVSNGTWRMCASAREDWRRL
jgi:hypothetical protein